jgi:hypothetical protein
MYIPFLAVIAFMLIMFIWLLLNVKAESNNLLIVAYIILTIGVLFLLFAFYGVLNGLLQLLIGCEKIELCDTYLQYYQGNPLSHTRIKIEYDSIISLEVKNKPYDPSWNAGSNNYFGYGPGNLHLTLKNDTVSQIGLLFGKTQLDEIAQGLSAFIDQKVPT